MTVSELDFSALMSDGDDSLAGEDLFKAAINDRYEVHRVLGEGSFAIVYGVYDRRLPQRKTALKLSRYDSSNRLIGHRFRSEIDALSLLADAQNVVRLYDFDTLKIDGQQFAFYTMENMSGSLLDLLQARDLPFEWADAVEMLGRAGKGLSAAHGHGIVHRDVKPENILYSGRAAQVNDYKISDFGIVKTLVSHGTNSPIGTGEYMPPEQHTNPERVDPRADVYALAVTLHVLTTRQFPCRDYGTYRLVHSSTFSALPMGAFDLFSKALEPNRLNRVASVEEFMRLSRELASDRKITIDSLIKVGERRDDVVVGHTVSGEAIELRTVAQGVERFELEFEGAQSVRVKMHLWPGVLRCKNAQESYLRVNGEKRVSVRLTSESREIRVYHSSFPDIPISISITSGVLKGKCWLVAVGGQEVRSSSSVVRYIASLQIMGKYTVFAFGAGH